MDEDDSKGRYTQREMKIKKRKQKTTHTHTLRVDWCCYLTLAHKQQQTNNKNHNKQQNTTNHKTNNKGDTSFEESMRFEE